MAGQDTTQDEQDDRTHRKPPAPARRASREQRRETTLQKLTAGEQAHCAYCGEPLPPLPSRGGRPTPYCPADADRYGQWGAKTISCAMLDEHREIWVQVYGEQQPMTPFDLTALQQHLDRLNAAVDPVRTEVAALHSHASDQLEAALAARETAERERDEALEAARTATAERDQATDDAEQAREQAQAARAGQQDAERTAARATEDAESARDEAAKATDDRAHALEQLNTANQRLTETQQTLADERAAALEQLDQARHSLRATLREEHEQQISAQREDFEARLKAAQDHADQRIAALTQQLTDATRGYADNLAPLHDKIDQLRGQLAEQTTAAAAERARFEQLHETLARSLDRVPADGQPDHDLRRDLRTALNGASPHGPDSTAAADASRSSSADGAASTGPQESGFE
ncbi:hypothetical protein INP57_23320 [Saccharopolyspora sp. HNM0986]|uniref:hypothetical protein n=1 Tax=Saccharopolyspora galaxeae TaxID=2781241 RepID=UPI0019092F9B|nr:hypothetical protein [Saccharopolyspora sp. HNM0986]MBK0869750.1 hypothetical protein [Saccharopolyspora sp. HNM0986]